MLEHWEYIFVFKVFYNCERTHVEKGSVNQELKSSKNKGE